MHNILDQPRQKFAAFLRLLGVVFAASPFFKRVALGVLLVNVLTLTLLGQLLYQSRCQYEEQAVVSTQNLARLLERQLSGTIEKVDLSLFSVSDEYRRQLAGPKLDLAAMEVFMARLKGRLGAVNALRLADTDGTIILGGEGGRDRRVNVADRPWFMRLKNDALTGLLVDGPQRSRFSNKWVIVLARRISAADGSFAGVVVATMEIATLTDSFSGVDVGQHGSVSLRDASLRILARAPQPPQPEAIIGQRLPVPELQAVVDRGQVSASYQSSHTVDGVERQFSVRRVSGQPLYIVVGRSRQEDLAPWRDQLGRTALLMLLFFLATTAMVWLLARAWQRQQDFAATLLKERSELRRSLGYNRSLIEASLDPMVTIDLDGKITDLNEATEKITGYSRSVLVGTAFADYFTEPERAREGHRLALKDGVLKDFKLEFGTVPGAGIPVLYNASVYRDEAEVPVGVLAAARDISARVQAERQVQALNQELEQRVARRTAQLQAVNHELEEFSYSMSHDMRTPLRAIVGYVRIFLDEQGAGLGAEGRRLLCAVQDNALAMSTLIDGILEFLRLGRCPMEAMEINMEQLFRETFSRLAAACPNRAIHLQMGPLPTAWADPAMVHQAVEHLLANAIKFTRQCSSAVIEIDSYPDPDGNVYRVRDNGVGFDMKYQDKLFKVFERVHGVGEFEGAAIGLALVKRIVVRHGGRVWAEGKVGAGAMLCFTLPTKEIQLGARD